MSRRRHLPAVSISISSPSWRAQPGESTLLQETGAGEGLSTAPPDGNTDAAVLILINTSAAALSVICNKCRRRVWREQRNHYRPRGRSGEGTGAAQSARPANWLRWGLIKSGFSETFDRFAAGKSLFACQFKRPLKELILILIGTSYPPSQCAARIRNELLLCVCACARVRALAGVCALPQKKRQVKLTANTSDRPTNEGSAHTFSLQDPDPHLAPPPPHTCPPLPPPHPP